MDEEISITFTKDEWRALAFLARNNMKGTNIEDLEEKRRRLQNLLASYERDKNMLIREEMQAKTFKSIIEKIDVKL